MGDDKRKPDLPSIKDEPGWDERFQHVLQKALSTPPQHRKPDTKKRTAKRAKSRGTRIKPSD